MRIPRIYLETTLFNFYVDEDRGFVHDSTVALFQECAAGKYKAFTSRYVIDELAAAPAPKCDELLRLVSEYGIPILESTEEAATLADMYVSERVIPEKYRTDALHIAIAAANDLDMIISMNFQHIVKRRTINMTAHINRLNGYRAVEIYSPMEVVENEYE
jgi:predicted nucleic acid-binding protein